MDDITFCLNGWRKECMVTRCERHPDNIRDKTIPHSFSEFYKTEYCPLERPKEKDLVEVIRCKDCKNQEKFFQKDGRRKDGGYYIYGCYLAEGYSHVCLDDDYCSRAERKEGKHETN